jgi:hypothetical protein
VYRRKVRRRGWITGSDDGIDALEYRRVVAVA